jgi:hypothetical protein
VRWTDARPATVVAVGPRRTDAARREGEVLPIPTRLDAGLWGATRAMERLIVSELVVAVQPVLPPSVVCRMQPCVLRPRTRGSSGHLTRPRLKFPEVGASGWIQPGSKHSATAEAVQKTVGVPSPSRSLTATRGIRRRRPQRRWQGSPINLHFSRRRPSLRRIDRAGDAPNLTDLPPFPSSGSPSTRSACARGHY